MKSYDLAGGGEAMYLKLYKALRADIRSGDIPAGARLPSKRVFADELGVSVVTVEAAYRLLCDEGYAASRERSGVYVCKLDGPMKGGEGRLRRIPEDAPGEATGAEGFQYSALTKIMREVITEYGARLLTKPPHLGCAELRNAIAEYLLRYRGMLAQPERIIIGSGSEYMYGMLVQLLGRDKIYGVEDPSYEKIRKTYRAQGAEIELLPMDRHGVSPAALAASKADVLHVTPFHSFPSGVTATAERRREYLQWASSRGAFIIEDDFDSEFSLQRRPLETLFAQDGGGRVIYMNTFSHSLAPSMRMGYIILPEELMALYEERLGFYYCSVPLFDQYVLAKYIERGHFERHLNRVRRRLKAK